jgi:hypothetical protein
MTILATLLTRAPVLGRIPWRLVGTAALAGVLVWGGWHVRGKLAQAAADRIALAAATRELDQVRQQVEASRAIGKADAAAAIHYAAQAAAAQRTADQLRAAVFAATQRGELVTTPDEDPADASPDVGPVLSPVFRLCWTAATTGDPDDVAACEAGSSHAASGQPMLAAEVVR